MQWILLLGLLGGGSRLASFSLSMTLTISIFHLTFSSSFRLKVHAATADLCYWIEEVRIINELKLHTISISGTLLEERT